MRQFISSEMPDKKGLLKIAGKDYRYLRQVLRICPGDMLSIRLPDGELAGTTVCSVDDERKTVLLQVCAASVCGQENCPEVTRGVKASEIDGDSSGTEYYLFQYIAKPVKMEQIIRQAAECGVKYIIPVIGAFSQKSCVLAMQGVKTERIERIIREARQQSGSPVDTAVLPPVTTEQAAAFWEQQCALSADGECSSSGENLRGESAAVVLWERNENTRTLKEILGCRKINMAAVAVGCEGGISADEISVLSKSGFVPVHFATNILRCETAALYGMAAIQSAVTAEIF